MCFTTFSIFPINIHIRFPMSEPHTLIVIGLTVWHINWVKQVYNKDSRIHVPLVADPIEPDKITAEGIMKFLDDLNLSPESKLVLIIAWKFRAAAQCEFSREEFMTGMTELWYVYFHSLNAYLLLFMPNWEFNNPLGLICLSLYGCVNIFNNKLPLFIEFSRK